MGRRGPSLPTVFRRLRVELLGALRAPAVIMRTLWAASAVLVSAAFVAACSSPSTNTASASSDHLDTASAPPIANFAQVSDGLYRGGHPDAAGLDYLQSLGIKTIVDLEVADLIEATPSEIDDELAGADARNIAVVRYPMSAFEPAISTSFDTDMDSVLTTLGDPIQRPIFVHCKHGQDRTGLVIGLERVKNEEWNPADAYAEMLKFGFHTGFIGLDEYFEKKTNWSGDD